MNKGKFVALAVACSFLCLISSFSAYAQNAGASGKVVDNNGVAVIGAGVVVKGTTTGTVTNVDGAFSLNGVAAGTTLEISCIGYEPQTVVWDGKALQIVLSEDALALEEVVVVGYGTMKKSDLTGSVAKADLTAAKTAPNSNILQAIQGNVAGLQIGQTNTAGGEPDISIRGQITISGNTDPLVVVDGIIYNGKIGDLSPADIESIDILKDASSKAVYGSRAANGVVMITTRGGRKEAAPKVTYASNWSWSNPTQNFRPLNRAEWLKKTRDVDYKNAYTAESGYTQENPGWSYTSTGMTDDVYAGVQNGTEYDWWGNSTQTGHLFTNTLSVSGGSKNVSYFISGGYTDQKGLIQNDNYKRGTLRTNIDVNVTSWLTIGTNTFLSFVDNSGDCPSISTVARMPSVVAPKDASGNWIVNPTGQLLVNPFLTAQSTDSDKRNQINSTVYAVINIPWVKGLSYRLNYNFTKDAANHYNFNQYEASQKGEAYKYYANSNYWLLDNIVNYSRTFNRHSVNATFVYGANQRSYDETKALGQQFSNFTLGYNDISQAVIQKNTSEAWKESSVYQMLRLAYNYDSRYFFTATIRRDGYSGFAKNYKFGWFPSVGLGWTISREPWMANATAVDNLKVRASYGVTGNQTSRYSSLARVDVTSGYVYGDGGTTASGLSVSQMGNNDLKWETTGELNVGIDFGFFKNRLFGNIDYYNATTKNLLWNVAVPSITGFTSVATNVGELNNQGIEFTLGAAAIRNTDFHWDIGFNFSVNRNKIVSLTGQDSDGDGKEDDLIADGLFIGESLGTIYGYEIAGIWQLSDEAAGLIPEGFYPGTYKIVDQDGDGKITAAKDRVILGHSEPDFRMGLKNTFSYKGFDLSFFFNCVLGAKNGYLAYNEKANYLGNSTGNATNQNWMNCYDYWSPSNPNAKFATAWSAPTVDVDQVQSRSFVRLQDLSFGYTFNPNLLRKAKIEALRLYVSGKNLLTFTSWDGWDPELALGVCSTAYPVMRSYAFGVEITF